MITGASRAEAAPACDRRQGRILENSKRHGYLLSMLGIRQVAVLVNKNGSGGVQRAGVPGDRKRVWRFFKRIRHSTERFHSDERHERREHDRQSPWKCRGTRGLRCWSNWIPFIHENTSETYPFRFPVQDIYKFTETGR